MNRTPHSVDEQAWQAQERALSVDARDRGDALLARALQRMPASPPPPDLVRAVLQRVEQAPPVGDDALLERILQRALVAVFAVGAVVSALVYGGDWWTVANGAFGGAGVRWALAGAACLALSTWPALWSRRDPVALPAT